MPKVKKKINTCLKGLFDPQKYIWCPKPCKERALIIKSRRKSWVLSGLVPNRTKQNKTKFFYKFKYFITALWTVYDPIFYTYHACVRQGSIMTKMQVTSDILIWRDNDPHFWWDRWINVAQVLLFTLLRDFSWRHWGVQGLNSDWLNARQESKSASIFHLENYMILFISSCYLFYQ